MRILIADDELMSRRLLEKTMQRAGYEVTAVENGQLAATELCKPEVPRLALLDWIMPELDGPAVCREVRKRKDQSYVYMILLTSKEKKEDVVAGLESGADDYCTGKRILDLEDRLIEAREEMRFQATHDALTSLWNRGVVMELLGRELTRARRENKCTAILLGDLDHFKSINDTYGHLAGDEVLKETARRLVSSVRSYDFVGRFGGEEFLVTLNNCDPAFGLERAEKIGKIIADQPVETSAGSIAVSMSFGLLLSQEWGYLSVGDLLHEVDTALYAAKAAGRNCIKVAVPKAQQDPPFDRSTELMRRRL